MSENGHVYMNIQIDEGTLVDWMALLYFPAACSGTLFSGKIENGGSHPQTHATIHPRCKRGGIPAIFH